MKKILIVLFITLFCNSNSFAGVKIGKGEVVMSERTVDWFITYIRGKRNMKPMAFIMSANGEWSTYWYCPEGSCRSANFMPTIRKCEEESGTNCGLFARRYTIIWKNDFKPKKANIKSKWSDQEIKDKLKEWGFYGVPKSSTSKVEDIKPKVTKKKKEETKELTKTYETKGERSIALSWDGYDELIAGTVKFNEKNYKGTLNLPLPNNDGNCSGSYTLQTNGKGTWQIACTNDMGAAGTLKWKKGGSVTGLGRDHNDRKVKFTVSSKS